MSNAPSPDPTPTQAHVVWHEHRVAREDRQRLNGHAGCVVWFTGLSGCGKSTIANEVEVRLAARGVHSFLLDGDNVRHGLNASPKLLEPEYGGEFARRFGLGFSPQDREENIRRVGAVAELFCAAGLIVLTAFVSPYRRDRERVRKQVEGAGRAGDFLEVFVDAPLEVCEARDPKGLYRKARAGEIPDFTGVHAPYEPPVRPELHLRSAERNPGELADDVLGYLQVLGKIK